MHRRSGHHQQQRAHEAKRRVGADSGTASSADYDEAPHRARHANGSARGAKRQRNAVPSRRHAVRRHAPSSGSSSSSTSSSAVALTPYAIEAGAAVAAAYPHAITPGEAATLVATMAAEGAAAAAGDSSDSSDSLQPGTVVADRFALGRVAGSGGFGVVYEAVDMADPHRLRVAIKMEKGEHRVRSLRHEAVVFAALAGGPGVPPVLWSGSATAGDGKRVDVLVMPLLGVSLYDYMRSKSSGHLAPEAVMHIGRYILRYLEHMHARGWLHRDVKPHNFLLDRSRKTIYMVDYGLAKRWCDPRTGAHVEYERRRNRSSVPGTAKYASLNTHQGVGASFSCPFFFFLSLCCFPVRMVFLCVRHAQERPKFSETLFSPIRRPIAPTRLSCAPLFPLSLCLYCVCRPFSLTTVVLPLFVRFSACVSFFCLLVRDDGTTAMRRGGLFTVQSRRDDLEALAYTLVQLARGTLPWDSVPGHNKAKRCARIRECKAKTSVEAICDGLPSCFARFLAYARALSFPETPDYNYCRRLFGAKSSSTGHQNNNNNNNRYHGP